MSENPLSTVFEGNISPPRVADRAGVAASRDKAEKQVSTKLLAIRRGICSIDLTYLNVLKR